MEPAERTRIINDFLASLQIFSTTMQEFMERQLGEKLEEGLTVAQYKLLKLIEKTDAQSIGNVAEFLGVSNPAASKAVDRLVGRSLTLRCESPSDRRTIQLKITSRGRELLAAYERVQDQTLQNLFRQFLPEEFENTADMLDRLSLDLAEEDDAPDQVCFRCGVFFRERCLLRDQSNRVCYLHLKEGKDHPRRSNVS